MVCPTCLAIRAVLEAAGMPYEEAASLSHAPVVKRLDKKIVKKVKRKASAYNKRYAAEYKRLKKKHPRTSFAALAKKAHKAARRK
jgi:predicted DsbA family dithiol-disulfide isomerase